MSYEFRCKISSVFKTSLPPCKFRLIFSNENKIGNFKFKFEFLLPSYKYSDCDATYIAKAIRNLPTLISEIKIVSFGTLDHSQDAPYSAITNLSLRKTFIFRIPVLEF